MWAFLKRLFWMWLATGIFGWLIGLWSGKHFLLTGLAGSGVIISGFLFLMLIGAVSLFITEVTVLGILKERLYNRIPIIGGWIRRKAAKQIALLLLQKNKKEVATCLAEVTTRSEDNKVRQIALEALRKINAPAYIDAVVAIWLETRHLALTNLLVEQQWVASAPEQARIYSALKIGKPDVVSQGGAELVAALIPACADFDPTIAQPARQVLFQLPREDQKEALCRFVIEQEHPLAIEAVLTIGYLPRDPLQRALFLFLTEQWERYETFDFDHALLNTAHKTASSALRQRIADKLRKAGRIDFLTVLVGADYRSRAADMTPAETDVLVQMLTEQREWARLWNLIFEIPFVWGIKLVNTLKREQWQPEGNDERTIFQELRLLADEPLITSAEEARRILPLALKEARIHVKGRVNDVAFAPTRPVIAIGTGNRKVGLWNFQRGEMEQVLTDFAHSVGSVRFLPDGALLCAERTNSLTEPCAISLYRENQKQTLGAHEGSVTAIEVVNDTYMLSTGRDEKAILWDIATKQPAKQRGFPFWARAAKVSPDTHSAVLLHQGMLLISLPDLESIRSWPKGSVGHCTAFVPDKTDLIVGKTNGEVLVYNYAQQPALLEQPQSLKAHAKSVQGIAIVPTPATIITAGSEGTLHFTNGLDRAFLGSIAVPDGKFTSLQTSPDGVFMATGDSDASMSLWDLRVLELPSIFTRPMASATPDHLVTINELSAHPELDATIQRSLRFLQKVLYYRFRFDIEIGEVPTIKVGEFDIEIE